MPSPSTPDLLYDGDLDVWESALLDDLVLEDWCAEKGIPCDARCIVKQLDEECRSDEGARVQSAFMELADQVDAQDAGPLHAAAIDGRLAAVRGQGQPRFYDTVDRPCGKAKPGRARSGSSAREAPWQAWDVLNSSVNLLPTCRRQRIGRVRDGPPSASHVYRVCRAGQCPTSPRLVQLVLL